MASEIAKLSDQDLVRRYVDAAFGSLQSRGLNTWPGTPPQEMWAGERDAEGWRQWRLVASTVTEAELDDLQTKHGLPYPPIYRTFLEYAHFVELEAFGLDFERHLPGKWASELQHLYFNAFYPERIIGSGLLPFGRERLADAGLVCFDTNRHDHTGDSPVLIWDHEWVDTDKETVPLYSSARKLFECQLFYVESNMDLNEWEEEPTDGHRKVLEEFFATDAVGFGSTGRRWVALFYPRLVSASI
jgi:hypothetical protein